MTNISIRPATPDDTPLILSLIQQLAEYEKLSHEMIATEELLREHLFGARPSAEVMIGCYESQPVGFALFFTTFSTFLGRPGIYLEDLFVMPEFRGRGVGKALLRHLARLARERSYGRVEWSVLDWNAHSIAFYKSVGAVPMDEWTVYRLTGEALTNFAGE
jgi:GNAT superfamily N-acetyltransferase